MAFLAFYAHVSPAEFEDMDPADTIGLHRRVERLLKAERDAQTERTKALMKAMGARVF